MIKTAAPDLTQAISDAVETLDACGECDQVVSLYADDVVLGTGPAAVVCPRCALDLDSLNLNPTDGEIAQ